MSTWVLLQAVDLLLEMMDLMLAQASMMTENNLDRTPNPLESERNERREFRKVWVQVLMSQIEQTIKLGPG